MSREDITGYSVKVFQRGETYWLCPECGELVVGQEPCTCGYKYGDLYKVDVANPADVIVQSVDHEKRVVYLERRLLHNKD